ncbi:hypothetical protein OD91_1601 [Lutibacter sp. Hel_I_33_5]|uniref:YHS domain-containing (seleno)protein n=1 Tax=Lutibacter sp. Hel_I_33_5 TaxID=1566289 RepID=UPI0011A96361|nr:YHS domain-containing (seleno)protein [Lutibacter sp. Hel_I_33_5]TVZ56317.1 hypothetical protein OD91_1601 [Lutibacter sp. Hel_I_33_5]
MKQILALLCIFFISSVYAQKEYNTKKGYVVNGYDVVSYFYNKAEKGNKKFTATYDGAMFKFSSKEHLNMFNEAPENFIPQYGGYCAYAIALKGEKVSINPKTFEIRENKLYLFYNSWGTNTLYLWNNESPKKLTKQADKNWKEIFN